MCYKSTPPGSTRETQVRVDLRSGSRVGVIQEAPKQDGRHGEGVTYMLATFIQQVINGLMLGGSYALVAIGYRLMFGVLNRLHRAQGEVAMMGSYVGLTLVLTAMSQVGVLPIWVVLIAAMVGAGIVGIIVELIAFRPLGRKQLHI